MWLPAHDVFAHAGGRAGGVRRASRFAERRTGCWTASGATRRPPWRSAPRWADIGNPTSRTATETHGWDDRRPPDRHRRAARLTLQVRRGPLGNVRPDLASPHEFRFDLRWPGCRWTGQRIVNGLPVLVTAWSARPALRGRANRRAFARQATIEGAVNFPGVVRREIPLFRPGPGLRREDGRVGEVPGFAEMEDHGLQAFRQAHRQENVGLQYVHRQVGDAGRYRQVVEPDEDYEAARRQHELEAGDGGGVQGAEILRQRAPLGICDRTGAAEAGPRLHIHRRHHSETPAAHLSDQKPRRGHDARMVSSARACCSRISLQNITRWT